MTRNVSYEKSHNAAPFVTFRMLPFFYWYQMIHVYMKSFHFFGVLVSKSNYMIMKLIGILILVVIKRHKGIQYFIESREHVIKYKIIRDHCEIALKLASKQKREAMHTDEVKYALDLTVMVLCGVLLALRFHLHDFGGEIFDTGPV